MSRKRRPATQRYHDRVAGRYDAIYDDAYWAWHDALTWEHVKAHLPRALSTRVLDLGCGTGKWGLKLLEAGYHVTFVDISADMLDQARRKVEQTSYAARAAFLRADLMDLSGLEGVSPGHPAAAETAAGEFGFAVAMGEPLCCVDDPLRALRELRRRLTPDGVLVATFDNRLACVDHYIEGGDPQAAAEFLRTGRTRWLTREREEQFELHTFTPAQLRKLLERGGYDVLDLIGKTALPMRQHRDALADPRTARKWAALERGLHRVEAALGRCAHLQAAVRVTREDADRGNAPGQNPGSA